MARRSEHSLEEIKEMILKAAEDIIVADGFQALKVRRIALEIGYTVGSIYMVFENMADLIMHVKGRTLDELGDFLDEYSADCPSNQQIIILAKKYLEFASQHFNLWSMIFEHRLPKDQVVPEWYQNKVDQAFVRIEKLLGQLAPEYDQKYVQAAARAIWSGVHGICILSLTDHLPDPQIQKIEEDINLLVRNFIRGWVITPV